MEITFTTPALLFPALSLLLLAYTNRFLALAALTRELHAQYKTTHEQRLKDQLASLQYRINIVKQTQVYGVASFFGGVLCTFLLFAGLTSRHQPIPPEQAMQHLPYKAKYLNRVIQPC